MLRRKLHVLADHLVPTGNNNRVRQEHRKNGEKKETGICRVEVPKIIINYSLSTDGIREAESEIWAGPLDRYIMG